MPDGPPYRLEITLSEDQWERLNAARGHEPRASFVKRALESALNDRETEAAPGVIPASSASPERTSASSRAPVEKPVANVLGSKVRRVPSSRQAALNKAKGL